MSPHELAPYRPALDAALAILGWTRREVELEHERDPDTVWTEAVLFGPDGDWLISEDRLSLGLLHEILRLAGELDAACG